MVNPCSPLRDQFTYALLRKTRRPVWIYLRSRDERLGCSISLHHALWDRGFLLFCEIHRRSLSPVCTTNTWRGTSRSEGKPIKNTEKFSSSNYQLLDRCLEFVDPGLYIYLRSKNLSAEIYAFPCEFTPRVRDTEESITSTAVLTLCACTPPLDQVLKLWDFLLAFGVHLNVLCVIAQLLLMRDDVMASSR